MVSSGCCAVGHFPKVFLMICLLNRRKINISMDLIRLEREFYCRPTIVVAKELLGKYLVKDKMVGKIVETEAYIGTKDKASHASWRKKESCFPMWGVGGFSYVYFTYGMHYMFNVVTEKEGFPSAVLVRALEPVSNILGATNGPGRLTKALGITKADNNVDLTKSEDLYIAQNVNDAKFKVVKSKRVGIDYAGTYRDKLWRFYIEGNKFVSRL